MDSRTRKQLDEIGSRYLRRAAGQLDEIKSLIARIREGDYHCLTDLDHLTHQIHGTAAMFGFHTVSNAAGDINKLLQSFEIDPSNWDLASVDLLLIELGDALHDALASHSKPEHQKPMPNQDGSS